MDIEINMRMAESRIQSIINFDQLKNKQIAVKTKILNEKLAQQSE